ncbi:MULTISPECIES: hypothetical protein [Streptomyces]|uniref:Uncharacterized protein n=1 Tax=Streptomyces kaempferi TaxID=333725 RepID=A0ABW3XFQ8_9ACTN|nr:hypothetical protein [Streptomyces sp. NBC_01462]
MPGSPGFTGVLARRTPEGILGGVVALDTTYRHLRGASGPVVAGPALVQPASDAALALLMSTVDLLDAARGGFFTCALTDRAEPRGCAPGPAVPDNRYDHAVAEAFRENHQHALAALRAQAGLAPRCAALSETLGSLDHQAHAPGRNSPS